jgi:Histone acetyl transferase HAT1 N-terminus
MATVSCAQDVEDASELSVEFTHQLFEDERIFGCEQAELSAVINYSSVALHCWVNIDVSTNDVDGAAVKDGILHKLAPVVPPDFTLDKQHFVSQLPYNEQVCNSREYKHVCCG